MISAKNRPGYFEKGLDSNSQSGVISWSVCCTLGPHELTSLRRWIEMRGYQYVICNEYEARSFLGYVNEQHVRYSILQNLTKIIQ